MVAFRTTALAGSAVAGMTVAARLLTQPDGEQSHQEGGDVPRPNTWTREAPRTTVWTRV
jgi:hypothetical protein